MKNSKFLILGILVVSLSFTTTTLGQCIARAACGVDAFFMANEEEADCARDGEALYYIVSPSLDSGACALINGVVTITLPDGRIFELDNDANMAPNEELFYDIRVRIPGYGDTVPAYVFDCNDPPAQAQILGTSIRSDGSQQPGTLGAGQESVTCAEPCIEVTKTVNRDFTKVGDPVIYTICVTNCSTGSPGCNIVLTDVVVVDPLLGGILNAVDSNFPPDLTLEPGETVCENFTYIVQLSDPDPLENCVTASGVAFEGERAFIVEDTNCATVDLVLADLTVEKICPPLSYSKIGDDVCYDVNITNTGEVALLILDVNDSLVGTLPACIGVILAPGQSCVDSYCYTIQQGDPDPLLNKVTVVAEVLELGNILERESNECSIDLVEAGLSLEKICPPLGYSKVGDDVCYELQLTNTGEVPVLVLDAFDTLYGPILDWVGLIILPGEIWPFEYCIEVPQGAPNPLRNDAFVLGEVPELGNIVDANDFCEVTLVDPNIDLEKAVEPNEACPGDTVTYTICIENTGDVTLENIVVNDPMLGGDLPGFPPVLPPGGVWCEYILYTIPPDANVPECGVGVLENCATVTSNPEGLPNVIGDEDCADICCPPTGDEGCTPGFWKNNGDKHGASAWCDRFEPSDPISMHFSLNETLVIRGNGKRTISNPTLLQALDANGGGVNAMIRHGIAAMLNACSDCVQYEYSSPDQVISWIEGALNGDGPYTVGQLHSMFAEANEAGCPVNQHGECKGVDD